MTLESINPATGEPIRRYPEMEAQDAAQIVHAAHEAYCAWRTRSFAERGALFKDLAQVLEEGSRAYASLITEEMGKPIKYAVAEVEKCAAGCNYFAEHAAAFLRPELIKTDASKSYVTYQPLGVMLGLMPWNFPFWQIFRFAVPALMAGNTVVVKIANNVSGCGLAIERLFKDAGFPENVFRLLLIDIPAVESVIRNPKIQSVSLTGSTRAGRSVASIAGSIPKRTILELGGSDPFIVLEDADLDVAVEAGTFGRLFANGQSCIASKRLIPVGSIRQEFERRLVERFSKVAMGDPTSESTSVGPLARPDLRETLHRQVTQSIEKGARLLLGGKIPEGDGAYYPPTILAEVGPGMAAYHEEVFGPVAAIIPAMNEAEAIRIANDTGYGLGATVCSRDVARAEAIAATQLEAGSCFVNTFVHSDPRLPFGGIKGSGYGRELGSQGIRDLCNAKTVYIA